jgi:serine protease Do
VVMASADQMFRGTVVTSGDIGLTVQPLDARAARAAGASSGALVAYVSPDGPSHDVLWVGDVVTAVNGQPVGNADGLRLRVSRTAPGVQLTLTVLRNGSLETVPLVVRARPAAVAAPEGGAPPATPADLGLTLRAVPNTGAEVVRVRPDSAAALAGLRPADLIMSVARIRTPGPAEVSEAWDAMPPGGSMFLGVERAGQAMAVVLEK